MVEESLLNCRRRDPAFRCDVSEEIKSAGLSLSQRRVVAGKDLAGDRDNAVTMMVIEEVSEGLFPNQKLCVRSVNLA